MFLRSAMNFRQRLAFARQEIAFERHHRKKCGGFHFVAYCLKCEIDFDRMRGIRSIAPNDRGVMLIAYWNHVTWLAKMTAFILTGVFARELDV
jgi:hypothetical protein